MAIATRAPEEQLLGARGSGPLVTDAAMTCWAMVPVKRRAVCKARLAGQLAPEARLRLVRTMLAGVVEALRHTPQVAGFAVVSDERDTLPAGIAMLPDAGAGLNDALDAARAALLERGAGEILVLPADLPFVTGSEIGALVDAGRRAGGALATDRAGLGSNALWLPARAPFRFQFGSASRQRHVEEARRLGLGLAVVSLPGLAFDVDDADDLEALLASGDPRYAFLRDGVRAERRPAEERRHR